MTTESFSEEQRAEYAKLQASQAEIQSRFETAVAGQDLASIPDIVKEKNTVERKLASFSKLVEEELLTGMSSAIEQIVNKRVKVPTGATVTFTFRTATDASFTTSDPVLSAEVAKAVAAAGMTTPFTFTQSQEGGIDITALRKGGSGGGPGRGWNKDGVTTKMKDAFEAVATDEEKAKLESIDGNSAMDGYKRKVLKRNGFTLVEG